MGNIEYYCEECEDELESDRVQVCCISASDDCECQGMPEVEELCERCEKIKDALVYIQAIKPCNDCFHFEDNQCQESGCVFELENFFEKA